MTFKEVLAQVVGWLQQDGRVSYLAVKRQFNLDDDYLSELKEALAFSHPQACDEEGKGLVWTGELPPPLPDGQSETDRETRFHTTLSAVMWWLQRERRITYRTLKHLLRLDDTLLEEVRKELALRQLAVEDQGQVLVWTGETRSISSSVMDAPSHSAPFAVASSALPTQSPETETRLPSNGPIVPEETIASDVECDEPTITAAPTRTAPEAERRQLTVMFCDLVGSTDLSSKLDPEDLREVIRLYQETAAKVIERYEGHIAQYLGDGLLIYFGWPQAHENDAERAVYSGLEIPEVIATLNTQLETNYGVKLAVRIGIHTGPVVVGEMGGGGRRENLALGETPNIAARLEGIASPNTAIISPVTAQLLNRSFVLEDLGPHELKGVAEPMPVFQVLRPLGIDRDEDESLPDGGAFLVGRDEEVGLLLRRWEQSKEGLGQAVLISGEAGIGKSSLVTTVRTHVTQETHIRATFRCSPYHTHSALYPVIVHLERLMRFGQEDTPETRLDKLEQALNAAHLSLAESVPLLAALLSVSLEDRYPTPTLSPQQQRQQTLDTLVGWLMAESEKQPVLAIWEDLHWADPSTLELLGLVLEQSPTVSILNVLTFRPEFSPPWPTRSHMTPITLNRLERAQAEAFIRHLADGKTLPTEVVAHILTKTDGIPLYVEELTKMLLESKFLREDADHYELTGPLTTVAIPDTLQSSLMARLDQLDQAKEVAQLGSVLGREFSYEMLEAISSQDEATLQAGLLQLVEAELVYQRGRPPKARYIFKHVLIQDVAYQSLLRSTRQQYHQRIAQMFEAQFPETAATQPELLARHFTEAGLVERAIPYWQQGGENAIQRFANQEAIAHLMQGLEVIATLPDTPQRTQQEITLNLTLSAPIIAVKGYTVPEVEQTLTRARVLCEQIGDTPRLVEALLGLHLFYHVSAMYQTARELGEQSLSLARHVEDPGLLLAANVALGVTLCNLGELAPARTYLEQDMTRYDPQQHRELAYRLYGHDLEVFALMWAARALWLLGYADQAREKTRASVFLSEELAHPHNLAGSLGCAAILHQLCRESTLVKDHAEALITLSAKHGLPVWAAHGMIHDGWLLAIQGRYESGMAQMRQGLAVYDQTGGVAWRPYFLALLAEASADSGNIDAGLEVLAEALELVDRTKEGWWEAELYRLKGMFIHNADGGHRMAAFTPENCFQQALDIARRQQAKSLELRAAMSLARLWQTQDQHQDAYDLLAPVYDWFTEGFDTADLQEAKALLTELSG